MTQRGAKSAEHRAAQSDDLDYDRLGPWRLLRQVGEGEWSWVFQACPADQRGATAGDYAVKVLKPQFESHPGYVGLFQREAWVGRQVSHAHLLPVLASSLKRPPYWLALPFLEGASLESHLSGGRPLSVASSLWIARQVAEALVALHAAGWLHGDVKPHNILVSSTGHGTLIDLGFARPLRPDADHPAPGGSAEMVAATPAYASPETFETPPRFLPEGDIYSLGVTLYECLAGRRPFGQTHPQALADAHRRQPIPDVRQVAPRTPIAVAELVWRLLAKDPSHRPSGQTLLDLLVSLEIENFERRAA